MVGHDDDVRVGMSFEFNRRCLQQESKTRVVCDNGRCDELGESVANASIDTISSTLEGESLEREEFVDSRCLPWRRARKRTMTDLIDPVD